MQKAPLKKQRLHLNRYWMLDMSRTTSALTLSSLLVALQDETCQATLSTSEDQDIRIGAILEAYERQMMGNESLEEDAAVVEEATVTEETGGEEE